MTASCRTKLRQSASSDIGVKLAWTGLKAVGIPRSERMSLRLMPNWVWKRGSQRSTSWKDIFFSIAFQSDALSSAVTSVSFFPSFGSNTVIE